jgi:hypothetical protein
MGLKEDLAEAYLKGVRVVSGAAIYSVMAAQFTEDQKKKGQAAYDAFKAACKGLSLQDIWKKIDQLVTDGFDWISDPLQGALDFPGSDWMFFARKGGDCDKWASFHFDILSSYGFPIKMYAIFDGMNISTSSHIISIVQDKMNNKFVLCSNYDHCVYDTEQKALDSFKTEDHVVVRYPNLWYVVWKKANC